jgi:hypothetical protein
VARRRSRLGLLLAGIVVIVAGFGIALVEALRLPKGSIWGVVGAAIVLVAVIRLMTRSR